VQSDSPSERPSYTWANIKVDEAQTAPRQTKRQRQREKRRKRRQGGEEAVPADESVGEEQVDENEIPIYEESAIEEQQGESENDETLGLTKRERQRIKRRQRRKEVREGAQSNVPVASVGEGI